MSEVVPIVIFGGGFAVGIVAIIAESARKTSQTKALEESRREIAAYVAEGTMSPQDAAMLLDAGKRSKGKGGSRVGPSGA